MFIHLRTHNVNTIGHATFYGVGQGCHVENICAVVIQQDSYKQLECSDFAALDYL